VSVFVGILIGVHLLLCGILIMFVLMHRGQGGGLSDMFGGGVGGGLQGSAVVERNLDRLTVVMGLIFAFLTVSLAFILDT
jgi:preprotein translocase subunit SecG